MPEQPPQENRPKLISKKPEMIIRARINEVQAVKGRDGAVSGIEIQMDFEKVEAHKQFVEVWFHYRAMYAPDIGHIAMKGLLLLEITEKRAKRIADAWNNNRELDQQLAHTLLQNINYKCGTEGVLAAKLVELPSPIIPPPIGIAHDDSGRVAAAPKSQDAGKPQSAAPRPAAAPPAAPPQQQRPLAPPPRPVGPSGPTGPQPQTRFPTFNTPFPGKKPN